MWPTHSSTLDLPQGSMRYRSFGERTHGSLPLVLLHGFPQTHAMWQPLAQALGERFFCIAPDLRGYGDSFKPEDAPGHAQMSKRVMAQDVVDLAAALGFGRFLLCGHDRGARVAHRLALDHASRVQKLCVIDIAPTLDMYARTDMAFARAYYHWFHLIQPAPLPEMMIAGNSAAYLRTKLGGWGGSGIGFIGTEALAEYERCFTHETIHCMCEDYRASAGIDLTHDREGREAGHKIACPTQVIWGERGIVHRMFDAPALWQAQCSVTVRGQALPTGHFVPEEAPEETAQALIEFFSD